MSTKLISSAPTEYAVANIRADIYDDGYLRVEHDNYYIACGGRPLRLPLKEFLIISRLVRNIERLVTSEELWRYAWGERAAFNAQSLHVHIYRLRHKLAPFGLQIETKVHVGYCLTKKL
ncbi:MAG TPA: helix-turn-helix domain-containing protein [Pyrinomonadaceae bacterium]